MGERKEEERWGWVEKVPRVLGEAGHDNLDEERDAPCHELLEENLSLCFARVGGGLARGRGRWDLLLLLLGSDGGEGGGSGVEEREQGALSVCGGRGGEWLVVSLGHCGRWGSGIVVARGGRR